jgi:ubiquinone/menaquinone biosynthesis C-methylase UbiE
MGSSPDKAIEQSRYDRRAAAVLSSGTLEELGPVGADGVASELRSPYIAYERAIRLHAKPGSRLLDLCCGNGQHSMLAACLGAEVTVSDIAPSNISLTLARAEKHGLKLAGVVADAENIPFPDSAFDVVTVAGSLSYVNLESFLAEVDRVLRPAGAFIFVDSLNHNPIYRLNRFLHFKRGLRTRSTLERMPTLRSLERIRRQFPDLTLSFHGIFTFASPVLRPLGQERVARLLDAADQRASFLHRYAFKVVGIGHKRSDDFGVRGGV